MQHWRHGAGLWNGHLGIPNYTVGVPECVDTGDI
jgi:hypothetical protein